jgi:DNA excision repair protein ERCC-3
LINKHEERGDKIIVFGDKLFLLNEYGRRLKIAVAHGGVSHEERVAILDHFQVID